jgi:hypothetical protein
MHNIQRNGIALCFSLLAVTLALSQPSSGTATARESRLPDETELKAAYCLAVTKQALSELLSATQALELEIRTTQDTALLSVIKEAVETSKSVEPKMRDRFNRLQSFLLPRISQIDARSLMAAYNRGVTDNRLQNTNRMPERCVAKCQNESTANNSSCIANCLGADAVHVRTQQCNTLTFLPF